jgi:hypothetical protein
LTAGVKDNSRKRVVHEEFRSFKDNAKMTAKVVFLIILSTLAVFAFIRLRNGTMLKILGKLTEMLKESKNISQVHRFLMKKFKILNEIEIDSYDIEDNIRTDPEKGTAYIVNESGILNYAFLEKVKIPLDEVLNNGVTTIRSYKWSTQHNGNEYINCYFAHEKFIGLGYTFYPLESETNELKIAITSRYNMVNDLLNKKFGKPKVDSKELKHPSYFVNDKIFSSTFLAFCGYTLFLFKKDVLKETFISDVTQ